MEPEMVPQRTIFKVLLDTFTGSLKNSLRTWFFKEPWFERLFKWCFEEPCIEGSLRHLYRFFEELFKEMVL